MVAAYLRRRAAFVIRVRERGGGAAAQIPIDRYSIGDIAT